MVLKRLIFLRPQIRSILKRTTLARKATSTLLMLWIKCFSISNIFNYIVCIKKDFSAYFTGICIYYMCEFIRTACG